MMIRIVVVDEQKSERDNIQALLSSQKDFEIVGMGVDGYDALRLVTGLKPDIALLNHRLSILDGVEAVPTLRFRSPKTGIIILTILHEDVHILKAIYNGASGYLLKDTEGDMIIAGIRTVYNGGSLMSAETVAKAFRMFSENQRGKPASFPNNHLPSRETPSLMANISRMDLQMIILIGRGLQNKEIAELLSLKVGTVRNHITTILQKTGLRNRTQIAIYAYSIGLIEVDEPPWGRG
jgi:DNA-binding NarL/FixJ family response regulator